MNVLIWLHQGVEPEHRLRKRVDHLILSLFPEIKYFGERLLWAELFLDNRAVLNGVREELVSI